MALPCVCYKCARCITLESLKDPECLAMEKNNCEGRDCTKCDFTCKRFTEDMDFKRRTRILHSFKWQ